MTKCKKRGCKNEAMEDKNLCRYHQAKKEGQIKALVSGSTTLALAALAIVRKVKD